MFGNSIFPCFIEANFIAFLICYQSGDRSESEFFLWEGPSIRSPVFHAWKNRQIKRRESIGRGRFQKAIHTETPLDGITLHAVIRCSRNLPVIPLAQDVILYQRPCRPSILGELELELHGLRRRYPLNRVDIPQGCIIPSVG